MARYWLKLSRLNFRLNFNHFCGGRLTRHLFVTNHWDFLMHNSNKVKNVHKEGNLAPRPLRYQTGYVGPDGTIKMCSLAHSLSLRPKHVSVKLATDASAIVECSSASLNWFSLRKQAVLLSPSIITLWVLARHSQEIDNQTFRKCILGGDLTKKNNGVIWSSMHFWKSEDTMSVSGWLSDTSSLFLNHSIFRCYDTSSSQHHQITSGKWQDTD